MPAVTVVIPAYNAAAYIEQAIESVVAQDFSDWELLVLDDASNDDTLRIASERARNEPRIRVERNDSNKGVSATRNRGIVLATGRYIAWLDADDIADPHRLSEQAAFLDAHPEVGIVGGYLELFDANGILGVRRYPAHDVDLRRCIFRYSPISQGAAMIRRALLVELGGFDESLPVAEDLEMTFRIGLHSKLANLDRVVTRVRMNERSLTATRLAEMERLSIRIRRRFANAMPAYRMSMGDKIYNALQRLSIGVVPPRLKIALFRWWRDTARP